MTKSLGDAHPIPPPYGSTIRVGHKTGLGHWVKSPPLHPRHLTKLAKPIQHRPDQATPANLLAKNGHEIGPNSSDLAQNLTPGVFFHEDSESGLKMGGFRTKNLNLDPKLALKH